MKKIIPSLIVLVVSFFLGEIAMRVISQKKKISVIETLRYSNQLRLPATLENPHPLHYKNKTVRIMGHDIRTNSLGLRDSEVEMDSGKKRVLSIGSSVTLGWGVTEEKTFSRRIEEKNQKIDVINAGVANTNSEDQFNIMKKIIPIVKPDTVLLNYFLYDAREESQIVKNIFLKNSFLGTYFYSWFFNFKSSMGEKSSLFDYFKKLYQPESPSWLKSLKALKDMRNECEKNNINFVVMIYPELHDVSDNSPIMPVYKTVGSALKGMNVATLDGVHKHLRSYIGKEKELWVSPTDPHGNHIVQEAMAEVFVNWHEKN